MKKELRNDALSTKTQLADQKNISSNDGIIDATAKLANQKDMSSKDHESVPIVHKEDAKSVEKQQKIKSNFPAVKKGQSSIIKKDVIVIGNIDSKRYHLPGMRYYSEVEAYHRLEFASEEDAVRAGYHKAPR